MNEIETVKLLTMIQRIYPNRDRLAEEDDIQLTAKIWQRLFQNDSYADCYMAFMNYASQNKFAPTPADIKAELQKMNNPEMFVSAEFAWEEVSKAIRKFGYYRQSEAYATFDPKLKRVVKAIGWSTLCHSERIDIVKSNFKKMWDSIQTTEKEHETLPFPKNRMLEIQQRVVNSEMPKM